MTALWIAVFFIVLLGGLWWALWWSDPCRDNDDPGGDSW